MEVATSTVYIAYIIDINITKLANLELSFNVENAVPLLISLFPTRHLYTQECTRVGNSLQLSSSLFLRDNAARLYIACILRVEQRGQALHFFLLYHR